MDESYAINYLPAFKSWNDCVCESVASESTLIIFEPMLDIESDGAITYISLSVSDT